MPRPTERQVQAAIVRALELRGHLVLGTNVEVPIGGDSPAAMIARVQRKRMGVKSGTPDLAVLLPGQRVVWLEVKVPAEPQLGLRGIAGRRRYATTTSERQDEMHELLRARGHVVAVVRSIDDALAAVEVA